MLSRLLNPFKDFRQDELEARINTIRDFIPRIPKIEKLKVAVASNKGGNAKTTTATNVAAAIHEVVGPSGRTVALIEANLTDPHIGDYTSKLLRGMENAPFLRFFQDEVREGWEGKKLFESLYEVPEHRGFFIGAVPDTSSSKIFLNRKTGSESYRRLSKGVKQLDVDFAVVDLGTGKNEHEILGFWNPSHIKVLSHKVDLEAVTDAVDLIKSSQLDSTVEEIALEVDRYHSKEEARLREELRGYEKLREPLEMQVESYIGEHEGFELEINTYNCRLKEITDAVRRAARSKKEGKTEEELESIKSELKNLRSEGRKLRGNIKKATERRDAYLSEREIPIKDINHTLAEMREKCNSYRQRISESSAKRNEEIENLFRLSSLSELEDHYKTLFGHEESRSQGTAGIVERPLQFNFSPTILLPNLVRLRDYYRAKRSDETITNALRKEGFSIDKIVHLGFYIPEANYVQQSNDDGIPLVWSSASSKRATNRYRELAWKIISHAYEGGL